LDQAVFHSRGEDEDVEAMLHKWLAKEEEEERAGGHSQLTLVLRQLTFWIAVLLLPNLFILALASTPLGDPAEIFDRHVRTSTHSLSCSLFDFGSKFSCSATNRDREILIEIWAHHGSENMCCVRVCMYNREAGRCSSL
jgi:hypothetical protein